MTMLPKELRQAILVVGMHRSGTSAVAGMLGLLGARLPAGQLRPHADNQKGYFESERLIEIHDRLFAKARTAWSNIERIPDNWFVSDEANSFVDEIIDAVREEYTDAKLFAVKDPRLCRLLPLWRIVLDKLGVQASYVITLRNPFEVARSLEKRDGFSVDRGCLLWLRHMVEAERETRGKLRVFLDFREIMLDPVRAAEAMSARLSFKELSPTASSRYEIEHFIDPALHHQKADVEAFNFKSAFYPWLWKTYEALGELVRQPNDERAQECLDRIFAVFDPAAEGLYAGARQVEELQRVIAGQSLEFGRHAGRVNALNQLLAAEREKAEGLQKALTERNLEIDRLRQTVGNNELKVASLESAISALHRSKSWQVTSPLRFIRRIFGDPS